MRIIKKIEIEGQEAIALFDTGALHTYVVRSLLKDVPLRRVLEPYRVALGGKRMEPLIYQALRGGNSQSFD
ncbi:MAG: hypothetical protein J7J44_01840 [Deltaproteobacteria bacterium]|nr:hypothetical protein [Deltaproteobacteria bacterium]